MARLAQVKQAGQVQPGVKMYKNGGAVTKEMELSEAKALKCGGGAKKGKK